LNVIACIGERLEDRDQGKALEVVSQQLSSIIAAVQDWTLLTIAYEPVWAIGTGRNATPEQAQEMHRGIRQYIAQNVSIEVSEALLIVYGGNNIIIV
jgi:triosephosphate isomerase